MCHPLHRVVEYAYSRLQGERGGHWEMSCDEVGSDEFVEPKLWTVRQIDGGRVLRWTWVLVKVYCVDEVELNFILHLLRSHQK